MKTWSCSILALGFLLLSASGILAQDLSQGRAVSLKVLQERLEGCDKQKCFPKKLVHFAGLTRVHGYVVDEKSNDLILIGNVDSNLPSLYLEDFVLALRNCWLNYAFRKGSTYYYSDPGCSIDPDPRVVQRLRNLGSRILGGSYPGGIEKGIEKWHEVCRSPQRVRVLGIPFDNHFASIMVKADYDMKRLVDGSDHLEIPGFVSLTDMTLVRVKEDIVNARPVSIPVVSMNRFWFYPAKNLYREDKGVVVISKSPVILLTEEEYLSKTGEIVGKGRPDPLAQKFAENFSATYDRVAKKRPVYKELESLFRFVALARIIKFKRALREAGMDFHYLLESFPVRKTNVSRRLAGRFGVKYFEHRRDIAEGYQIAKLCLPSCGGVGINVKVAQKNFIQDDTGKLSNLKEIVFAARPSVKAYFWDYPGKKEERD